MTGRQVKGRNHRHLNKCHIKHKNQSESSQDAETDGFLRGNLFSEFGIAAGT